MVSAFSAHSSRALATVMSGVLLGGVVAAPQLAHADTPTCTDAEATWMVTGGTFEWNVRDSWNNYLNGPIARGGSETSGNIVNLNEADKRNSNFRFTIKEGALQDGDIDASVPGGIKFWGHKSGADHVLDNSFSNFSLTISGTTATLRADASYREFVDTTTVGNFVKKSQIPLSTWTLSAPVTPAKGEVSFSSAGNGTFVHPEATEAFGGFYGVGNDYTGPLKAGSLTFDRSCPTPGTSTPSTSTPSTTTPSTTEKGSSIGSGSSSEGGVVAETRAGMSQFWNLAALLGVGATVVGVASQLFNIGR